MKKLLIGLREGLLDEFPVLLSLVRRRKVGSLWNAISYDDIELFNFIVSRNI